jgi:hypothetical protein
MTEVRKVKILYLGYGDCVVIRCLMLIMLELKQDSNDEKDIIWFANKGKMKR